MIKKNPKQMLVNFPVQYPERVWRTLSVVQLCRISYLNSLEAEKEMSDLGYTNINLIESSSTSQYDTQCYIAEKNIHENGKTATRIYVIFRGTDLNPEEGGNWETRLKDWKTNADFRKVHYPGMVKGKVHGGFLWSFQDIRFRLYKDLRSRQLNSGVSHGILVGGHSLGGGITMCAFPMLINEFSDQVIKQAYTFGQPRVGDWDFAHRFNTNYSHKFFRFVNNDDIVAAIPLMLMGFFHAGNRLYFNGRGVLYNDADFWYIFWDRLLNEFQGIAETVMDIIDFFNPTIITDHSIVEYERKVQAIAQFLVDNNLTIPPN